MKAIFFYLLITFSQLGLAQEQQLLVGMASLDMKPKIGIPLAGYGDALRRIPDYVDWKFKYPDATLFKPSEGYHSQIRAKTMALKKGDRFLVFVSLDTIGIEEDFIHDLSLNLEQYGIKESDLFVSATHTHGGPGTLSHRFPLWLIAVDFFRQKNYDYILEMVTKNIEEALASLQPAELYKTSAQIQGIQRNKWRKLDTFDNKASFLVAKSKATGTWMGGLVNFAIHGGTMPIELMLYSSDVNGAIEKELENLFDQKNLYATQTPVFLFLNGAEGDVGATGGRSVEMVDEIGKKFITSAANAFSSDKLIPVKSEFSSTKKRFFMGFPASPIKYCGSGWVAKLPSWVKVGLFPLLPDKSTISQAQLGDITFLTWPGEPSTQLGWDLKDAARKQGSTDPWVLGLTNDYMAYFTTKEEFKEGSYDACSSLYGWKGGNRVIEAHKKLLAESK
ncbi:MAG: neutral/alkaline non-lysosomal ceramidase N-terminal domain-containing protein [Bacteriovoracaceae bacterium]